MNTLPTITPLHTVSQFDGRHGYIPILAPWESHEGEPFHPLIASVKFGHGHASKEQALEIAAFVVKACNSHQALVSLVRRLYAACPVNSETVALLKESADALHEHEVKL